MNQKILIGVLVALVLIFGGITVYLLTVQKSVVLERRGLATIREDGLGNKQGAEKEKVTPKNEQQPVVGGDRDEHGCIGSAGYTWCSAKNKCLRPWEEECDSIESIKSGSAQSENGWSVYENKKYGFGFQYPPDLVVESINLAAVENGPGGEVMAGFRIGKDIRLNIVKISSEVKNGKDPLCEPNGMDPVSQKDITIAGLKARNYNDGEVYVVARGGYQYFLTTSDKEKIGDVLDRIVATFIFTN